MECEELLISTAFLAFAATATEADLTALIDHATRLAWQAFQLPSTAPAPDRQLSLSLCRAALDSLVSSAGHQECPTDALRGWNALPDLSAMGTAQGPFLEGAVATAAAVLFRHAPPPAAPGQPPTEAQSWAVLLWRETFFLVLNTNGGARLCVWRLGPTEQTDARAFVEALAYLQPAPSYGRGVATLPFANGFWFSVPDE